jgi:hypothetical protein
MVECQPSKQEVLSSKPSTTRKKEKGRKEGVWKRGKEGNGEGWKEGMKEERK